MAKTSQFLMDKPGPQFHLANLVAFLDVMGDWLPTQFFIFIFRFFEIGRNAHSDFFFGGSGGMSFVG